MQLITKLLRRASQFDCSGDATVSAFKERPFKEAQSQCDCASIRAPREGALHQFELLQGTTAVPASKFARNSR